MTPAERDAVRDSHLALRNARDAIGHALNRLDLPQYHDDRECCEAQRVVVATEGYQQWCLVDEATMEDGLMQASTNGWSDFSEDGDVAYLMCTECLTVWALPEDLEWN